VNPDPNSLLTTRAPGFTAGQAAEIARKNFGIDATASPLWSERDQNFRMLCHSGEQFVLKIANRKESPQVIDFQTRALEHIAQADPAIPVPHTLPSGDGKDYCWIADDRGREHMVRLITWLDGEVIEATEVSGALLHQAGGMLARLGLALEDFRHPAAGHHLIWDLKNAAELLDLLPYIDDTELRGLLEKGIMRFKLNVVPDLGRLRSQIIHADLNRGNMLVNEDGTDICGIIDFGDMVHTPLIMDLAIAAAYHLSDEGDPLGKAVHFIRGYHEVCPLEAIETRHLLDLMIARICTSITVQLWRAKLYPDNAEYLLVDNDQSQEILTHIMSFSPEETSARIMELCRG